MYARSMTPFRQRYLFLSRNSMFRKENSRDTFFREFEANGAINRESTCFFNIIIIISRTIVFYGNFINEATEAKI